MSSILRIFGFKPKAEPEIGGITREPLPSEHLQLAAAKRYAAGKANNDAEQVVNDSANQ